MREPVLVASVDGVGTKLKIAFAIDKHDTIGADLVNHCVNDIAVRSARARCSSSITSAAKDWSVACSSSCFLDFLAHVEPLVARCWEAKPRKCPACIERANTISRVASSGWSDRRRIIDGSDIKPGDVVLGLASTGLHTNGYSLARNILFDKMRLKIDFGSAGIENHGRRRAAARAQKLSTASRKTPEQA